MFEKETRYPPKLSKMNTVIQVILPTEKLVNWLIDACIEKYDLAIAANHKGYFLISNDEEYEE